VSASAKNQRACHKCGKDFVANSSFCTFCGASILVAEGPKDGDPYIGTVIDDTFEVEEQVGVGSMGVVYKAKHRSLGRQVALKILKQTFIANAVVEERFRREAQAASRLDHPNTIRVLHFGKTPRGAPYIAMEYLEGDDLSDLVAREFPMAPQRIANILIQVCRALEEAHGEGIIHRDLKPANIAVVNRRGEEVVKVLDFGIAKLQDTKSEGLTRDGLVCGTPAFMSPEQVVGANVGPGSDIFSLGAVAYFMLTGRLPFSGTNAVDMASAIMMDMPSAPSRVRLDVNIPAVFDTFCLRAMAKNVEDRYHSAQDARAALEEMLPSLSAESPALRGGRGRVVGGAGVSAEITQNLNAPTQMAMTAMRAPRPAPGVMPVPQPHAEYGASRRSKMLWVVIGLGGVILAILLVVLVYLLLSTGEESSAPAAAAAAVKASAPELAPEVAPPRWGRIAQEVSFDMLDASAMAYAYGALRIQTEVLDFGDSPGQSGADASESANGADKTEGRRSSRGDRRKGQRAEVKETPVKVEVEEKPKATRSAAQLYDEANAIWRANPQEAIKLLTQATRMQPSSWRSWELLGECYTRTSELWKAADAFEKVLKLNPDHPRRAILEKKIEAGRR